MHLCIAYIIYMNDTNASLCHHLLAFHDLKPGNHLSHRELGMQQMECCCTINRHFIRTNRDQPSISWVYPRHLAMNHTNITLVSSKSSVIHYPIILFTITLDIYFIQALPFKSSAYLNPNLSNSSPLRLTLLIVL